MGLGCGTEGYDPLVLDGAMPVLSSNRVRVLMFEYHGIGVWKQQRITLKVCALSATSEDVQVNSRTHVPIQ